MAKKEKTRAVDLLMELMSFVKVEDADVEKALASKVDESNREFKSLLRDYCIGLYDEDPDLLRDRVIALCK